MIEKAKWEVNTLTNLQVGHQIQISLPTKDPNLISYIAKIKSSDCAIEKNGNEFAVIMTCLVKHFRHMLDEGKLDSMAVLIPINRTVESIMIYIIEPEKCDSRFVNIVRTLVANP